jgi:peptide/nickel transport system substrate-binding protein
MFGAKTVRNTAAAAMMAITSAICLGLTASSASSADFKPSETLNWGESGADSLDPHATRTASDSYVRLNLYDTLYRYSGNPPDLIPWLATGYDVSPDNLTFTFKLRHGVKFHDGSELTADDVVYSFQRLLGMKLAPSAAFWPILKPGNITAPDRYTVRFILDEPYAPFVSALPLVGIVEKSLVQAHVAGSDWAAPWLAANDAGSGPYSADPGSFSASQKVQLTWFPDYFIPWPKNPVKHVNINTIREESTLALALIKGEVDGTDTRISANSIDRLKAAKNVQLMHDESMRTFQITMDTARKPLDNIHVRKAISYAFDYDGFIQSLRDGTVVRNPGPLPENMWGNPKDLKGYSFDMAKAKAEIDLAKKDGVDLSRTLTIWGFTGTQDSELAAELLQSNLRQLGIKLDIKNAYFGTLASMTAKKETSPDLWTHWVSAYFVDPENWIGEMYDSQFLGTWKASAWYKNPRVDDLLRKARTTVDQPTRAKLYEQASQLIVADAPAVWIYNSVEYRGLSKRISGYQYTVVGAGSEFRTMSLAQ